MQPLIDFNNATNRQGAKEFAWLTRHGAGVNEVKVMKYFWIAILFFLFSGLQVFAQTSLLDLKSLDELQKQFSTDTGKVRIIALLSPT